MPRIRPTDEGETPSLSASSARTKPFMLSEVQVRLEINVGARAEIQREGAQIAFEIEEVDDVEEAEEAREIAA